MVCDKCIVVRAKSALRAGSHTRTMFVRNNGKLDEGHTPQPPAVPTTYTSSMDLFSLIIGEKHADEAAVRVATTK